MTCLDCDRVPEGGRTRCAHCRLAVGYAHPAPPPDPARATCAACGAATTGAWADAAGATVCGAHATVRAEDVEVLW